MLILRSSVSPNADSESGQPGGERSAGAEGSLEAEPRAEAEGEPGAEPSSGIDCSPAAGRRPVVERIACWSARRRKTVLVCWLLFLGIAFVAGQLLGSQSRPQYD